MTFILYFSNNDKNIKVILPLLKTDFYDVITACCNGSLHRLNVNWKVDSYAVTVAMVSDGYPEKYQKKFPITG